jgi:ABC-type iron transport system FetAB permease component
MAKIIQLSIGDLCKRIFFSLTKFFFIRRAKKKEKSLVPHAVVPAAEMVLGEERAGHTEAADLFH